MRPPFLKRTMKKMSKKGQAFNQLTGLGIGIATLTIIFVVLFLVAAEVQDNIVATQGIDESNVSQYTLAYNGTNTLTEAAADIPAWIPLIVITVVGSILLGLVSLFRG